MPTTCCALSCILAYVVIKLLIIILRHCLRSSSVQLLATLHGHSITKEQALAPVDNCCLEGNSSFCQPVEHQLSRPLDKCYYTSSRHHMVCLLLAIAELQPSKQSGERATFQPQELSALAAGRLPHWCVVKRIKTSVSKYQKDFVSLWKC